MYGITETTVHVTHYALDEADMAPGTGSRVGRALPSLQLYLLDAAQQPVPIGVPGEIYVGGAGVARGYLGRPDLTAARFVPDPFGTTPGGRLYRAGDLARWRADSEGGHCVAEFLGRADQQVKLRGYRIEPGEIEAALRDQPGIRDTVVQLREDVPGERRLVAYVVPERETQVIPEQLQRALQAMLPDYMVPSAIVPLDVLPLTSNGKLDRRALPAPGITRRASDTYLAPRDGLELQLVRVWEELLHIHPVGVRDGFFELGGHSLLVLHLVAHIERTFDVRLSLADLVQGTTIERLALMIRQKRSGTESRFVLMQPEGAGRPVFGVVPAGGTLACYVSLAELMGTDRPFYALQPRNTMQETATARTIEAMAREDLEELQRIQPKGPYALAGWSMGGFVAYEMACLLRDAGEEVELLALLDIGVPDPNAPSRDPTEAALELGAQHLDLDLTELGDVTGEERMEAFLQLAQRHGRLAHEVDLRWVRVLADGFRISVEAMQRYRPRPYPGRVTLIRAQEHQENDRGLTQGWDALAQEGVDVYWVPGTHQSLVRRPQVAEVARRLRAILDGTSEQAQVVEVADVR
jgi:thioesterase domain-containing protein